MSAGSGVRGAAAGPRRWRAAVKVGRRLLPLLSDPCGGGRGRIGPHSCLFVGEGALASGLESFAPGLPEVIHLKKSLFRRP